MAWAICDNCEMEVRWRAGRGARLKKLRCPTCGGSLHLRTAGRTMDRGRGPSRRCVVCGRLRFTGVFTVPEDGICKRWGSLGVGNYRGFTYFLVKKGDIICWTGHYYDKGGSAQDTAVNVQVGGNR